MAMDNFHEEIVTKRNMGLNNVTYYVAWVCMIIFALIGLMYLESSVATIFSGNGFWWQGLIVGLVAAALAVLIWLKKDTLRVEYEYSFTNGDMDIAMVLNNSKRRYLAALPMKSVESAGEVTDPSFQRYLTMNDVKKHNWFLNRENHLVYFYFVKNGVKHLAILEPSEEMVKLVRSNNYLGFGVWKG